jgi:hypothetical protein
VPDALAPIADRLRPLIRLLASDQPGEVVAAARAIARTLKTANLYFYSFADSIGQVNGKEYTEAQLLKARTTPRTRRARRASFSQRQSRR